MASAAEGHPGPWITSPLLGRGRWAKVTLFVVRGSQLSSLLQHGWALVLFLKNEVAIFLDFHCRSILTFPCLEERDFPLVRVT